MDSYQENKTTKFCWRQQILLTVIIDTIITSIYLFFFDWPWKQENMERNAPAKWTFGDKIYFIIFFCIIISIPIIFYITNSKSYIELLDTHMRIKKAKIYPIPKMETKEISYKEIKTIKIQPTYLSVYSAEFLRNPWGLQWYKVILTTEENWKNKKIKFYWIDDWNWLNKVLQKIWIKSEFIE